MLTDLLMHWINLILTYCNSRNRGFPKIWLVATNRDQIPKINKHLCLFRRKTQLLVVALLHITTFVDFLFFQSE